MSRRFLRGARLRRKTDVNDTGATTQGTCIAFNANGDCLAAETILFPDGSTIEFQGIERSGGVPSARTIVGGSGRYLGAAGTMAAVPSADLLLWTKTIEIAPPAGHEKMPGSVRGERVQGIELPELPELPGY